MSLVDDFFLSNYSTIEELNEADSAIENELSILQGYRRGVQEKIIRLETEMEEQADEQKR